MAADIINLRQARKQKQRAEKERSAAENRALHGQTRLAKNEARAFKAKLDKTLDQGKLEKPE